MEIMQPMGLNFTPFISFHDIRVNEVDLFDDAWGFNSEYGDVIELLEQLEPVPGREMTKKLIKQIRKDA